MKRKRFQTGFTIVELLIVIVIIGVLAAVTAVAFKGIQDRASDATVVSDITAAYKKLELYKAEFGSYPATQYGLSNAYTDSNCQQSPQRTDWIPGLTGLPQGRTISTPVAPVNGVRGCFMYASDGTSYVLSAWAMLKQDITGKTGYRLTGFRELETADLTRSPAYLCNHTTINGNGYYKYSYTFSNIPTGTCA